MHHPAAGKRKHGGRGPKGRRIDVPRRERLRYPRAVIRRPVLVLIFLTGLNLLNYLDRFVLSAVLKSIQTELDLKNLEGGTLATVFLLGYFVTSPFFGALGDRRSRPALIAGGVIVWSLATVATGMARGFTSLLIARAVVGVGEASYATIAPTIIDDLAPPDKRRRWLAIFYAAIPVGSALGVVLGGAIGQSMGWRSAFYVAGGPGLLLAVLCFFIADPPRQAPARRRPMLESLRTLFGVRRYRQAVLGYSAYTFAIGAFAHWGPLYVQERYAMKEGPAGVAFGAVTVVGGALGTAIGGFLGDPKAEPRTADDEAALVRRNLRLCAVSTAIGVPLAVLALLSPVAIPFFGLLFAAQVAFFVVSSPINAIVLRTVPDHLRASAMALSIFTIHVLGDLWSPALEGALADHVPRQWAMQLLPLAFTVAAVLWWARTGAGARARGEGVPDRT